MEDWVGSIGFLLLVLLIKGIGWILKERKKSFEPKTHDSLPPAPPLSKETIIRKQMEEAKPLPHIEKSILDQAYDQSGPSETTVKKSPVHSLRDTGSLRKAFLLQELLKRPKGWF